MIFHQAPWAALLVAALIAPAPAAAQIQPGPNIAPNGTRFTYSPRFGYLGPPMAFVPDPPPPTPYYRPGSMPMAKFPRYPDTGPVGGPPVRFFAPPVPEAIPPRIGARPPRLPGQRPPPSPNNPCMPNGCERAPEPPPTDL